MGGRMAMVRSEQQGDLDLFVQLFAWFVCFCEHQTNEANFVFIDRELLSARSSLSLLFIGQIIVSPIGFARIPGLSLRTISLIVYFQ